MKSSAPSGWLAVPNRQATAPDRSELENRQKGAPKGENPGEVLAKPFLTNGLFWRQETVLQCDGAKRTQIYAPLPKWRRGAKRPSCLDLVTLLRKQLAEKPVVFATADAPPTYQTMVGTAAA